MDDMTIVRSLTGENGANLAAIFQKLDIEYLEMPLPSGISGQIERQEDKFRVIVNSNESPQRRRFTAAHELAHFLLHRDMLEDGAPLHRDALFGAHKKDNQAFPFSPAHEVQANRFAAELLMPSQVMRDRYDPEAGNLAELANKFRVSQAAIRVRLQSLGLL